MSSTTSRYNLRSTNARKALQERQTAKSAASTAASLPLQSFIKHVNNLTVMISRLNPETKSYVKYQEYVYDKEDTTKAKFTEWCPNGLNVVVQASKRYDLFDGLYVSYDPKTGKVTSEGQYINGKREGLWLFTDDVSVCTVNFKNGVRHGDYHLCFSTYVKDDYRVFDYKGHYIFGKKNGVWQLTTNDTQIVMDQFFVDDVLDTWYTEITLNQKTVKRSLYDRGKLIKTICTTNY